MINDLLVLQAYFGVVFIEYEKMMKNVIIIDEEITNKERFMSEKLEPIKPSDTSLHAHAPTGYTQKNQEQTTQTILSDSIYFQGDTVIKIVVCASIYLAKIDRSREERKKLADIKLEHYLKEKIDEIREYLTRMMTLVHRTNKPMPLTHEDRVYARLVERFRKIAESL